MDIFHYIEPRLPLQISRWWNCNRSQLSERTKPIRATTTQAICANSAQRSLCLPAAHRQTSHTYTNAIQYFLKIILRHEKLFREIEKRARIVMFVLKSARRATFLCAYATKARDWLNPHPPCGTAHALAEAARLGATAIMSLVPLQVTPDWFHLFRDAQWSINSGRTHLYLSTFCWYKNIKKIFFFILYRFYLNVA